MLYAAAVSLCFDHICRRQTQYVVLKYRCLSFFQPLSESVHHRTSYRLNFAALKLLGSVCIYARRHASPVIWEVVKEAGDQRTSKFICCSTINILKTFPLKRHVYCMIQTLLETNMNKTMLSPQAMFKF